ncbi:hypothetical protein NBO_11g0036 [Nosema bombycis CQ1]|uniref:Uncharacterized protein n=1 Tax=Nosema bombycis (strain CQ1 / CVCC 102059) TaxID=578461 RepID=R0MAI8_NOSB1|nr:hypothetical protein NBO_11g0036 [Nosema bombycis CQ1]|eukprot:EOB14964.1 hypothetical protein NBO_11g0036 [Nosema bombycis CQ1]
MFLFIFPFYFSDVLLIFSFYSIYSITIPFPSPLFFHILKIFYYKNKQKEGEQKYSIIL